MITPGSIPSGMLLGCIRSFAHGQQVKELMSEFHTLWVGFHKVSSNLAAERLRYVLSKGSQGSQTQGYYFSGLSSQKVSNNLTVEILWYVISKGYQGYHSKRYGITKWLKSYGRIL